MPVKAFNRESDSMLTEQTQTQLDSEDVTAALNAILSTDKFSASPQMSAFLKYVVEQTLLGNTRRIKAFTVGIEALGKSPNFDPQTDPSVRVLAKRLRSSLDTYYEQNPDTPVFIQMKPGSYVPKFIPRSEMIQPLTIEQKIAMGIHHPGTTMPEQPGAAHASAESSGSAPGHAAHLNVQQQSPGENLNAEAAEDANIEPTTLWETYKSESKVA